MKSLDLRLNEFVEGTHICKGCIPSSIEIFNRGLGFSCSGGSRSLTSHDITQWIEGYNEHFDREDCLLDLPDKVTLNITHFGNLKIRDDDYEIYFNHVLYVRNDE